jgi:hypothetical protein
MDQKRFRLDFVIAFCALLISTVAAVATVYQTRVIASEFSATVWPYVSLDVTNSPSLFEFDLRNDGLGPAIVRSATITLDGKPQPSVEALLRTFAARDPRTIAALRAGKRMRLTTSTPTPGLVIPANASHPIIQLEGAAYVQQFRAAIPRFGLSLCYCSLTGTCWAQSFHTRDTEPKPVASCARSS